MDGLKVAEIFTSIQGEGIWVGTPSTFIRVSGCNLRCVWCDTPYASWEPEGIVMDLEAIVDDVVSRGVRHVVLTGGEPMLFEPIVSLAERLKASDRTITVETAGTVYRDLPCDLMSVSPKLANSTPAASTGWRERHESRRLDYDVLRALARTYPCQFKFVVNPEAHDATDIQEIEAILEAVDVEPDRVLLMPEGTDVETLRRRQRSLVPICLKRGWRLSPRLHVELFGNRRGT